MTENIPLHSAVWFCKIWERWILQKGHNVHCPSSLVVFRSEWSIPFLGKAKLFQMKNTVSLQSFYLWDFCILKLFCSYTFQNNTRSEPCIMNQNRSSLIQWQLLVILLFTEFLNIDPEAMCPPTTRQVVFAQWSQRDDCGRVGGCHKDISPLLIYIWTQIFFPQNVVFPFEIVRDKSVYFPK